jgi:polyhydroxybutyrate depolymerase
VVLLHGYGMSGQAQENSMDFLPWSDQLGFLYVYPDGTVDEDGFRFWNATDACCDFYGTGVDDSGYLRALIDEIVALLSVDTERIFVLGYSNGGFMAYRMACDHADIIAAVASLSGTTFADPADCEPSAPVRALQIHGTDDPAIDYQGGATDMGAYPGAVETAEIWATYNNCSTVPDLSQPPLDLDSLLPGNETEVAVYGDGCDEGGISELWTIVDGDHMPRFSMDFAPLVLDFLYTDGGVSPMTHRQFIPAAAYAAGAEGAFFRTDVDLSNADLTQIEYRFFWLPRGEDNSEWLGSEIFSLGAGMCVRYGNVLAEVFDLEPDSLGALLVVSSSPDLLLMSRTYSSPDGAAAGTFGQAIPAVSPDDFIQTGERRRILFASENADLRTNIGCQNGGPIVTPINIELFGADGTLLETERMILYPWSNDQLNRVFRDYRPVDGYVEVSTTTGDRSFYCYGSVLDNVTSDPTTILPQ